MKIMLFGLLMMVGTNVNADDYEQDGIVYKLGVNNEAWVKGYTQVPEVVDIPETISPDSKKNYSVIGIETSAFYNCHNLTSIKIPESVRYIVDNAFTGCSNLVNVTLPKGLTDISSEAFMGCSNLASINIPSSVTSLGHSAFRGCESLTSITIPYGIKEIAYATFEDCYSLTNVSIPNSVTSIGKYAFRSCGLVSITIPKSVTSIGEKAFTNHVLTSIIVEEGNPVFDSREGCNAIIYTADNTLLFGCRMTTIPNSVTVIGTEAFFACDEMTSFNIPGWVTSIGENAFARCSAMTSVTISEGVKVIGDGAFRECSSLMNVNIPNSVTDIGSFAFLACASMKNISIPNSVERIGGGAFRHSKKVENVYSFIVNPYDIDNVTFSDEAYTNATLYVPIGTKEIYRSKAGWQNFLNIQEFAPASIESVHAGKPKSGIYYDTNGRQLANPQKCVNIIGGRKVLVK